jgi:hypothetical protein
MGTLGSPAAELARDAADRCPGAGPPVVVVAGCGRARTVAALLEHGVDAYGFDVSDAALADADAPRDRLLQCDLRDADLVARLRERFDVDRIDVLYTEQVLSLLAPATARRVTRRLRAHDAVGHRVHRIASTPPAAAQEGTLDATVRSIPEWRAACDPDGEDVWLSPGRRLEG